MSEPSPRSFVETIAIAVAMARSRSRRTSSDGEAELRRGVAEEEREEEKEGRQEQGEEEESEEKQEEEEEDEESEEGEDGEEEGDEEDEEEEEVVVTEYEKQRLKTIERNKAMLASLQLPTLVSSLAQSSRAAANAGSGSKVSTGSRGPRRRSERLKSVASGKRSAVGGDGSGSSDKSDSETESLSPNKRKRKDQEYEPTDDEGASVSESEDEVDEREEEAVAPGHGDMDDEEYALQQALALSLGASTEATDSPASSKKNKKRSSAKKKRAAESAEIDPVDELEDNPKRKPSKGNAKRKTQRMGTKRHFTEGEVDALFPFFDERGRGQLTLNDLERVSTTHDFTWSAEELLDMIHLFCRNHNGALDLVDFRNVATRCNLIISER